MSDRQGNPLLPLRKAAMALLARREYGHQELIERLSSRFKNRADATATVDRLRAEGLQSDERFLETVLWKVKQNGYGPLYVTDFLARHGFSDEVITHQLQQVNWLTQASHALAMLKQRNASKILKYDRKIRYLASKGFEMEHIEATVGEPPVD